MSAPLTRASLNPSRPLASTRGTTLPAPGPMTKGGYASAGPMTKGGYASDGPITGLDLLALFPNGHAETEQARGRFLSALRLGRAVLLPVRLFAALKAWNARRATTLALMELPEDTLRDIGLTRGEIDRVAAEAAEQAAAEAATPVAAQPSRLRLA